MMMPIAQEHTSLATFLVADINDPVHEAGTILIVQHAVGFQTKMYVSEYDGLAEEISH
jgi:hypothetical protein